VWIKSCEIEVQRKGVVVEKDAGIDVARAIEKAFQSMHVIHSASSRASSNGDDAT
jgi:hypothetical protein